MTKFLVKLVLTMCMAASLGLLTERALAMPTSARIIMSQEVAVSPEKALKFCRALAEKLKAGKGPFGLGTFNRVACSRSRPTKSSAKAVWVITLKRIPTGVNIQVALERAGSVLEEEKISIAAEFPDSDTWAIVGEERTTWLLALGILDILPVMGKWDSSFKLKGQTFEIPKDQTAEELEFEPKLQLVAVKARLSAKRLLWNISNVKDPTTAKSSNGIWLTNLEGRAVNVPEIEKALNKTATETAAKLKAEREEAARRTQERLKPAGPTSLLPLPPRAIWSTLAAAIEPSASNKNQGIMGTIAVGWNAPYISWFYATAGYGRLSYEAPYESTAEEPSKLAALALDETSFGIGAHYRHDLSKRLWATVQLDGSLLTQTVDVVGSRPPDFDFSKLTESGLTKVGTRLSANYLTGRWVVGGAGALEGLMPYFEQYSHYSVDAFAEYLLTGFSKSMESAAVGLSSKGSSLAVGSVEPASSVPLQIRLGPLFRVSSSTLDRTFPAKDKGKEDAKTFKLQLMIVTLGVSSHVSF